MALEIPFEVTTAQDHAEQMVFDVVGLSTLLTDLNIGGVARTLLEVMAIQLEALDSKMFFGLQRGIPTELYAAFNFPLLGAIKATGVVTFNRLIGTHDVLAIPAGTKVFAQATAVAPQTVYSTLVEAILINAHNSIDVGVSADVAGSVGNVSAGRISRILTPINHIASVYNYAALTNGSDLENQEQRSVRFRRFVQNLARSPLGGIESGAMSAQILDGDGAIQEAVRFAVAIEPPNTLGRVAVYVDNGGGTATVELVALAQKIIDGYVGIDSVRVPGYKAAGIVATVSAIQSIAVAVSVNIELASGFSFTAVETAIQETVEDFFAALAPGAELILVDLLVAIADTPGVRDAAILTPTANLNVGSNQRLLAGAITVGLL